MKVRNVIRGLKNEYGCGLEEINIIADDRVLYSGSVHGWDNTDVDMLDYKEKVMEMEVTKRIMFNYRKAFIFVRENIF